MLIDNTINQYNLNFSLSNSFTSNTTSTVNTTSTMFTATLQYPSLNNFYEYNVSNAYDDDIFRISFTDDIKGVRGYWNVNECYIDYFYYMNEVRNEYFDEQDFEINIFRLTLDFVCEEIEKTNIFSDLLDESKFSYRELTDFIDHVIRKYHRWIYETENLNNG